MYLFKLRVLSICPRVGLLDHMTTLFLVFWGFSTLAVPINIPINSVTGLLFTTPFPALVVGRVFNDGHSDQCEVEPNSSFDLHFSNNWLPGWLSGKEFTCQCRRCGSAQRRSPGERNGNPFQYFCLENPIDRGAWGLQFTGSQRIWLHLQLSIHTGIGHLYIFFGKMSV